jgi:hypothetical protein
VKSAFGGAMISDKHGAVLSVADDLKSAASDSLKKCATLLGVGLELYGGQPDVHATRSDTRSHEARFAEERATVRQLAAIHAASRRRGFSKERLASYVNEHTGKNELSHLSRREASGLIDSLSNGNGAAA